MNTKISVEFTVIKKSVFTAEVEVDDTELGSGDDLTKINEIALDNVDGGEYDNQINDSSVIDEYDFVVEEEWKYEQ